MNKPETHLLKDVFTPTRPANKAFIERDVKINDYLVDSLGTPGKQVVVYGHSGSGKTTLLLHKLNQLYERYIITRCMEGMSYENIIHNAFDQLNKYYSDSTVEVKGKRINPSLHVQYNEIKASFSLFEVESTNSTKKQRIIPPQLTLQKLAGLFGEINCCWVLEDFHKVREVDRKKVSQGMKIFMDTSFEYEDLKIIALGAVGTARQVVEYDKEMSNRIAEIHIPLMSEMEIREIINKGSALLNIKFDAEVIDSIIKYSCGLPAICHQLCLNICQIRKVHSTYSEEFSHNMKGQLRIEMRDFLVAIEKFIEERSDSFKLEFDKAVKSNSAKKLNIPKVILNGIIDLRQETFYLKDILLYLSKSGYQFRTEDVVKYIGEFSGAERGEILVYDKASNSYRFNNIFLKAYCKLRFRSEDLNDVDIKSKERKIIRKLLQIIDRDNDRTMSEVLFSDDFMNLVDEDEDFFDDDRDSGF